MVIRIEDKWLWDSWYVHDDGLWHAYFLQAPRSLGDPDLRHWNVTQGHAVSRDLRSFEHLGTCFAPSAGPAWDDFTTWTGSVVRDDAGKWHLFYTGTSRAENGMLQRIGHATSDDGHGWTRVGTGQILDIAGSDDYEQYRPDFWHDRAMRDPWVMRDPRGGWMMFFTGRSTGIDEANACGNIGFATSSDLSTWELHAPVFTGGFGQLEVPEVFEVDDRWYCLFCTAAQHFSKAQAAATPGGPVTGSHYLMADDPRGPWRVAPGPFLDGALPCRRYASRIVFADDGMKILGFADQPDGRPFVGEITDPDPVDVLPDGRLIVRAR